MCISSRWVEHNSVSRGSIVDWEGSESLTHRGVSRSYQTLVIAVGVGVAVADVIVAGSFRSGFWPASRRLNQRVWG